MSDTLTKKQMTAFNKVVKAQDALNKAEETVKTKKSALAAELSNANSEGVTLRKLATVVPLSAAGVGYQISEHRSPGANAKVREERRKAARKAASEAGVATPRRGRPPKVTSENSGSISAAPAKGGKGGKAKTSK